MVEDAIQVDTSEDFGTCHANQLVIRHVEDRYISKYHGTVENADDRWQCFANGFVCRAQTWLVSNIAEKHANVSLSQFDKE